MKHFLLHLLLQRASASPRFKRRLKIFAALSFLGVFLAGGLVIWAGVAAFDYAAGAAKAAHSTLTTNPDLETTAKKLTGEQPLLRPGCLGKASGLLSPTPWLERPILQSLRELREACLAGR